MGPLIPSDLNTPKSHVKYLENKIVTKLLVTNDSLTLGRPGGVGTPLAFFPCNFFDDSNRKNRLIVSVTRDGRHILAYVTSS